MAMAISTVSISLPCSKVSQNLVAEGSFAGGISCNSKSASDLGKCRAFFGTSVPSAPGLSNIPKLPKKSLGSIRADFSFGDHSPAWTEWRVMTAFTSMRAEGDGSIHIELNSQEYIPKADFYKVEAIVRPSRLGPVSSALIKMGIRGVTVSDVRGFGAQGGSIERQAGSEFAGASFVQKVKLEIVVCHDQVEVVIDTIIDQGRTGEIGDGKVFVAPVADVIRVRTGERGPEAERMGGGRADMQIAGEGSDGV